MLRIINAFANIIPVRSRLLMKEKLQSKIFMARGFQFCLTPSITRISLRLILVNVNGNGPANLLASFQSANGDPAGREIFSSSEKSNFILKPDLFELISFTVLSSF